MVNRTYRGDVDIIVGKALEKDKTRRYGSAAELAADLRRHLLDEPISARPPSTSYQLRKFARRNKALVLGMAAVLVALVLGVVASTWEAVKARRAEAKAVQQTAIAQAVVDFFQHDVLAQASAKGQAGQSARPDPDLKVRTALDRAAARIDGKFGDQPEVEAAIRETMGKTYAELAQYRGIPKAAGTRAGLGAPDLGSGSPADAQYPDPARTSPPGTKASSPRRRPCFAGRSR